MANDGGELNWTRLVENIVGWWDVEYELTRKNGIVFNECGVEPSVTED